MRLIDTKTLELEEFTDETAVKYAILSHRWEEEEVLFRDLSAQDDANRARTQALKGYYKIKMCCEEARNEGMEYAWVDTCCIDKSSSAELQEAINSMFRWYAQAEECYVYLSDVLPEHGIEIRHSEWFKRGWTLQELIAPKRLRFFNSMWTWLGPRASMIAQARQVTGVPRSVLVDGFQCNRYCVAEIMSWAKDRKTTRIEDKAYSLLGLFNVNMPLLYGEGVRAFQRLQEEILRYSDDQSIFAWDGVDSDVPRIFAESPDQFAQSAPGQFYQSRSTIERRRPHNVTNEGIEIDVLLKAFGPGEFVALLNACTYSNFVRVTTQNFARNLNVPTYSDQSGSWKGSDLRDEELGRSRERYRRLRYRVGIFVKLIDSDGRYVRIRRPFSQNEVSDLVHWPWELSKWENKAKQRFDWRLESLISEETVDKAARAGDEDRTVSQNLAPHSGVRRERITIVGDLREEEIAVLQTSTSCAFHFDESDKFRGRAKWSDLVPINATRHDGNSKAATWQKNRRGYGPVVILERVAQAAYGPYFALHRLASSITVGLDANFNPMCIITKPGIDLTHVAIRDIFALSEGVDPDEEQVIKSNGCIFSFDQDDTVRTIPEDGTYGDMKFAIFKVSIGSDFTRTDNPCILYARMHLTPDQYQGDDVFVPNTHFASLVVKLSRSNSAKPWVVDIWATERHFSGTEAVRPHRGILKQPDLVVNVDAGRYADYLCGDWTR